MHPAKHHQSHKIYHQGARPRKEIPVIPQPNAPINPGTVVVLSLHTLIAYKAVAAVRPLRGEVHMTRQVGHRDSFSVKVLNEFEEGNFGGAGHFAWGSAYGLGHENEFGGEEDTHDAKPGNSMFYLRGNEHQQQ